ncbi:hybrid sensor histidine kinase/response regulator [Pseudidiomarina donghaiensis]|uniref:hybrid sensor histidine kinase/response regulator n=1 Tax=Pseudidiomarina donghaiensis TaxID=519452 RepID=UPI003A98088B
MPIDREALRRKLQESFFVEAKERLQAIDEIHTEWLRHSITTGSVESLFREVHSLKGAARAAGLNDHEALCHEWENLLSHARHNPDVLTDDKVNWSIQQFSALQQLCNAIVDNTISEHTSTPQTQTNVNEAKQSAKGTVRVNQRQLDELLHSSNAVKQIQQQLGALQRKLHSHIRTRDIDMQRHQRSDTVLQQLHSLLPQFNSHQQSLVRELLSYADWAQVQFRHHHDRLVEQNRELNDLSQQLRRETDTMHEQLEEILLQPAARLLDGTAAIVRDLADNAHKTIEFVTYVDDIQIDKRMIDELRPVVTHMLRNAVDHGIVNRGVINVRLQATMAGRFELMISDNGRGIDIEKLYQVALKQGAVSADKKHLTERDKQLLMFTSGVSTSDMITEVSGRGIGMTIAQEILERIGGKLKINSKPGQGTQFVIDLPTSMSTFQAVVVRCDDDTYALPALSVDECIRVRDSDITRVKGRPTITYREQQLALIFMRDFMGYARTEAAQPIYHVIVIHAHQESIALCVDELVGNQELTVKPLGAPLHTVQLIMGAAEDSSGHLTPIINPNDILRMTRLQSPGASAVATRDRQARQQGRILVVDDSFTSRGLLKSIIEAAGYNVTTANDGHEAWNILKQNEFDLLVSDIEMPKMDGFVLTSKVRADHSLNALPVILVTALQSPEDQTRGLEAGANAYLVKSSFEQDSLLDAIARLI